MLVPISEPIARPEGHPGSHWTLGTIDFAKHEASYYDSGSLPTSDAFSTFKKVCLE